MNDTNDMKTNDSTEASDGPVAAPAARSGTLDPALAAGNRRPLGGYAAQHFGWQVSDGIARITLNRPERKNPLTFDSYAEMRDLFEGLRHADDVKVVVVAGAGDNFCSGGDVHEIIGPLVRLKAPELLMFTRMTGDLVKAMRTCPQPIVAAIDGVCAGPARSSPWPRTCASARRAARRPSSSTASAWPAATWAPARCCRASSARAVPASCSTPAAPSAARRPSAGAS
jgi:hypothetical protein